MTPSTKAELGDHDATIDAATFARLVGPRLADRVRDVALRLYARGAEVCEAAGILLADTKFEFGTWAGPDDLLLVDELLTPDSSRFWDAAAPGQAGQESPAASEVQREPSTPRWYPVQIGRAHV